MYTTLVRVIRHALNKRWLLIGALILAGCAQEAPEPDAEPQAVVERLSKTLWWKIYKT